MFKVGVEMDNLDRMVLNLQKEMSSAAGADVTGVVGYEAPYAIYQHENLEYFHTVGEAKYLEKPARLYRRDMRAMIRRLMEKGWQKPNRGVRAAVLAALRALLKLSQDLYVPVKTGRLKRSGFVEVE